MRVRLINKSRLGVSHRTRGIRVFPQQSIRSPILSLLPKKLPKKCRSGESRLSGSHSMNFMFLVGLPFRGTFQFSFTVLVHYRFTTEYLALDRRHDPYSVSTLKLTYSQDFSQLFSKSLSNKPHVFKACVTPVNIWKFSITQLPR